MNEVFETFKVKAEAAGNTEVQRFATKAEALNFIERYFKKEDIRMRQALMQSGPPARSSMESTRKPSQPGSPA